MSNEEFEKYKEALAIKLLEKPMGLMEQAFEYQTEIDTQNYNFNRSKIEVEALKKVVKNDIVQFYQVNCFSYTYYLSSIYIIRI